MPASRFPRRDSGAGLGTAALGLAKILENMEIGHNVMHGQWDWMRDPEIHSSTWEWDNVCPADQWKHSHNVVHHTWTNVMGKDRDVGYEILRVNDEQPWKPVYLAQPFYNALLALLFQWGVAMHDLDLEKLARAATRRRRRRSRSLRGIGRRRPASSPRTTCCGRCSPGPASCRWRPPNLVANLIRNVWSYAIIFCGHFPDGVQVFTEARSRARRAAAGTCASCSARATSRAVRCFTS